jgi:class 3 adenylate cyclase/tetratricopeptide (TPR) repeat protein
MAPGSQPQGDLSARIGELRRLTFMYCDVVGSTELSGRQDVETYREMMRGYRDACRDVIESRFEGHIVHEKGDGALSTFGFPVAHENDAERAVRAGLALVQEVRKLFDVTAAAARNESLDVRVGVHHGPVYLDLDEADIYGLAANVGARLQTLADPGTVVISEEVRTLVADRFDIEVCEPRLVKGLDEPLAYFCVRGVRARTGAQTWVTPLVERDEQLARLRQAWTATVGRSAEAAAPILIRADAGLGKTRLTCALTAEVRRAGHRVVELRGSSFHADVGLHPVRDLIETRCCIRDDSPPAERLRMLTADLTALGLDTTEHVPLLAPVLGIDPSAGYQPAAAEGRKLEEQVASAALAYLRACTGDQPSLLVGEDLHWFDEATRDLLIEMVRTKPPTLLVVATSRKSEPRGWDTIELHPLSPDARLQLIAAIRADMSDPDRRALAARSDGVPLFLEQLVRAGSGASLPADASGPVPGSVPAALYEPLVARLYQTPDALPVAATAAAAGQSVERSVLSRTITIPAEELDSALAALVERHVLEPVGGPGERYRFRHELLREVAYEMQPQSWRRKAHDRLCDVLLASERRDWPVLALHFERAERHLEAATAYESAAEWARRRGAIEEARAHLTRGVDVTMAQVDGADRDHLEVELRLRRGFLAMSVEGAASAEASADFERCMELAANDPEGDEMASTLIALWAYDLSRANLDRARQTSETLRRSLVAGRGWFGPQNLAGFGMIDWFRGNFDRSAEELTEATEMLANAGRDEMISRLWFVPSDATAAMYTHHALARFMAGDVAGAEESFECSMAHCDGLEFPQGPWSAAYTAWLASWMWIEAGQLSRADDLVARINSSSARHGFDNWELVGATHMVALEGVRLLQSESDDAPALADRGEAVANMTQLWEAIGLRVFLTFYMTTAGALFAAAGDRDQARRLYDDALALGEQTGMHFYDAETMRRMALLEPEPDAHIAGLAKALEIARSQGARPFELRISRELDERQWNLTTQR